MPTLPWTTVDPTPAGEVVVMASWFRVRSLRHVLPFLVDALRVHRQVRAAEGVVGVSLEARPLRQEFRTLSAWRDRAALEAMVAREPHRTIMRRHHPAMAGSAFVFWTVPAGHGPPTWTEAGTRLAAERSRPARRPS
jgi:quinol monooxygenase YgiN